MRTYDLFYPVQLKLPKNHKIVEMTLHTTYAYAFLGSITDMTATAPFTDLPTGGMSSLAGDASQAGLDVVVTGLTLAENIYSGDLVNGLMSLISGQQLATYMVKVVNFDGTEKRFNIPIGSTTIAVSPDVDYIEIRSTIASDQTQYQKEGRIKGTVAYENAHEIDNVQNNLAPTIPDYQPMETISPLSPVEQVPIADGNITSLPSLPSLPLLPSSFVFASGAGGWSDVLTINNDGSFTGEFYDSDWDAETNTETVMICNYSGRFTNIKQVAANIYTMNVDELWMSREAGQSWIENGVKYSSTTPYGITRGAYTLYLPETTRENYPSSFEEWYYGVHGSSLGNTLGCYAIVNEGNGYVFWGERREMAWVKNISTGDVQNFSKMFTSVYISTIIWR